MTLFSYSFCMAILHSLWQAALLMLLYRVATNSFLKKDSPLGKRNFLFAMLLTQVFLFTYTFFVYYAELASPSEQLTRIFSGWPYSNTLQAIAPWVFGLYTAVILFKLTGSVYSWVRFQNQFRTGLQKAPVDLKLFTGIKARQFGITRNVRIWLSHTIHTPVTFGFFKPTILLPVALVNHISLRQAETLIIHELIHIRTNDYLLNWLLLLAETLFFFNPFVVYFCNSIRLEREKNCDMGVIAFEYSPVLYAETLLQAERMKQLVPGFQLAAVTRKKQLLERIRFFSGTMNFNQGNGLRGLIPTAGLLLCMLIGSSLLVRSVQVGNSSSPFEGSAATAYIPASSIEIPGIIGTDAPVAVKDQYVNSRNAGPEPAGTKERITSAKLTATNETVAVAENNPAEEIYLMPVAITENDGSKQIIIQEESSGSAKTSTLKTYALRFVNGQWILEPVWTISAKQVPEDSILKKMDSSAEPARAKKIYPSQQ